MPGLRTFLLAFCIGQVFLLWWMGQYDPTSGAAAELEPTSVKSSSNSGSKGSLVVWSADAPCGKTWGNKDRELISFDGNGCDGSGKAITLTLDGNGWRGCGLNWKGWYPEDAADDVSKYKSLTFLIRQVTDRADADLTIHLKDNLKRPQQLPVSNPLAVVANGALTRIDSTWRKVVLPLEKFAANKELDLRKIWGIDFSTESSQRLVFQIDRISFNQDSPPPPKFPTGESFNAVARVNIDGKGHMIPDGIYGVCDLPGEKVSRYGIPITRWGGNRTSRFNWKINADSAGKDWFFKNGGQSISDMSDSAYVKFIRQNQQAGATAYLTIPMLGYVAKDHHSHAFSVGKYGKQQAVESGHSDVGNGVSLERGAINWNDPEDTSVAVGPQYIAEAVRFVSQKAGRANASNPGVKYWVLDNEPMLWHLTHRDVRKKAVGYDELWDLTVKYAEAIKREDPSAKVAGFCSWGWSDLFYSAADEGDDQYRSHPDFSAHGRIPLAEWFIMKCADYKKNNGKALIDVFDLHWYPQAQLEGRDPYLGHGMSLKFNQLRMRTTRDLWDPAYVPESWTKDAAGGGPAMVVRRAKEWIAKHNPGMELSVGEYNFGGSDNITGGLAQADVLGILAREQVDLAFIWNTPEGTQELAWKLFRDYDQQGGRFGDRYLPTDSNSQDVSVYAAKRSKDGATTIVVVNKSLTGEAKTTLDLPGLKGRMRMWRFDQETDGKVMELPTESKQVNGAVNLTIPAASATMIVIE
ncbi:glycoside hydrolase family 44 protein [Zavarzinella formosa]|uniref:glycoside hydrolase family 44 protein n=1 Tax=Zavarzinella formosa TaxID=360055 RepID=UPI000319E0E3|nr:glycoside hydrolase family 44 protein [Zavarzinella formosa]